MLEHSKRVWGRTVSQKVRISDILWCLLHWKRTRVGWFILWVLRGLWFRQHTKYKRIYHTRYPKLHVQKVTHAIQQLPWLLGAYSYGSTVRSIRSERIRLVAMPLARHHFKRSSCRASLLCIQNDESRHGGQKIRSEFPKLHNCFSSRPRLFKCAKEHDVPWNPRKKAINFVSSGFCF